MLNAGEPARCTADTCTGRGGGGPPGCRGGYRGAANASRLGRRGAGRRDNRCWGTQLCHHRVSGALCPPTSLP